ncbi:MAG: efflux RND transporter permease subunit [Candidatus Latescibacterota bacterium]|nr:MAG: efflux RND transporter permease subunit [Candidatus Latescibacterota bacterium]
MKNFFEFFAKRHTLANLVTIMTILLGLHSLSTIKRDLFPEVDFGELTITTVYPGASPEDVELNVTNNLEDEIREVAGLDWITSFSMENISVVYVRIDPDERDQEKVKREIRDAIDRVTDFPDEVTEAPLVTEWTTDIFPVIEVGLSGDIPYTELRELARRLEKDLKNLPGVASLDKFGYLEREVHIEVNPKAMKDYHVSLREVMMAIAARNVRATGGSFESYTAEKKVVTLAQFDDVMEVKDVIVRTTFDGPIIRIRDLAEVKDDFEEERVRSRMNGKQAISFLVNKKGSADVIRTVDEVKALVESLNGTLPEGVEILYADDQSYYVRNRLQIVGTNGLIGLSLVLLMLSCFLSLRSAFWVALGIPVTLLGVIFLMPVANVFIEVVSLAVLVQVIGIIVDDGIIVAENIHKYRERGYPPLKAAVEGIHEVFWPVVTTIVTTFVAFAPMLFMTGMMGKFVRVVPIVMSLALFITLFEVVVALPAHVIWGLRDNGSSKDRTARSWFNVVRRFYKASMRIVLKLRYLYIFVSIVLLAFSLWYAVTYMDFVLFPSDAADTFYMLVVVPTGSSLQHTADKVAELEAIIQQLPDGELNSFTSRIGNQGNFQLGENENWAIVRVNLTPYAERSRVADDIVEELRGKTDQLEGFESLVYYIDAGGPPVGRPVTIRVVGTDNAMRRALADSVVSFMSSMDGVKDIDRDDKPGKDQVQINIRFDRLARVGLTVADIAQTVRVAFDGDVVTSVRFGDEDVDFRVKLSERARENPYYLRELLIPNPQGRLIPLKDVATLETGPGPSNYYHFDGERAITVTSDVDKGVATPLTVSNTVVDHFDLQKDWPGMRFIVGGEAQEMDESMRSLFQAFIIAVLGIYFILILLFNSPTQPFIVMSSIPFGIMGVIAAFAVHGQDLGFIAMMGTIGLSGVVVNDSLVLVNHINRLREQSPDQRVSDIVAQGATDRLRAVLLTSLTTVAGVLPLAYGIGGSDPFIAPMVLALGWGILLATPITLGMIPCLYLVRDDIARIFGFFKRSK